MDDVIFVEFVEKLAAFLDAIFESYLYEKVLVASSEISVIDFVAKLGEPVLILEAKLAEVLKIDYPRLVIVNKFKHKLSSLNFVHDLIILVN